jgi:uncharacterized protein YkwD
MNNKKIMTEKYLKRNLSLPVFFFIVCALFLISSIQHHRQVFAQTPDNGHQIFLPLVINGSGTTQNDVCNQSNEEWLCRLNQYRQMVNLPAVTSDYNMSDAVKKHDNYLLLNGDKIVSKPPIITNYHLEVDDPAYPGYTPEGSEAGGQSNIVWNPGPGYTVKDAIDIWMTFSSHRYGMLHPDFSRSGFDLTCTDRYCASSLNVTGSLPKSYDFSETNISYPLDKQTGLATATDITWAFYRPWLEDKIKYGDSEVYYVSGSIIDQNGNPVEFRVNEPIHVDEFGNPDVKNDYKNQVALIPISDLQPNHTYRVSLTVRYLGQNYTKNWSFTTK